MSASSVEVVGLIKPTPVSAYPSESSQQANNRKMRNYCLIAVATKLTFLLGLANAAELYQASCSRQLLEASASASTDYIDPTTPSNACIKGVCQGAYADCTSKQASNQKGLYTDLVLVFSDEFQDTQRNFRPGKDPKWHAVDQGYVNGDQASFRSDAVTLANGSAIITVTREQTTAPVSALPGDYNVTMPYKSGMLQGWNKWCFTGGYLEARVKLPGDIFTGGLWPAIFTMGNLGRAGYARSTEGFWPYSYNVCDASALGRVPWSGLPGQAINACNSTRGRGAPEIDLFEVGVWTAGQPQLSTSLQMAPLLPFETHWLDIANGTHFPTAADPNLNSRPNPWAGINSYAGRPRPGSELQDAMSAVHDLNASHFEAFHTYAVDWAPGKYIRWYLDDVMLFEINDAALAAQTNARNQSVGRRMIPDEPSYIIMNVAMSDTFVKIDPRLVLPAAMEIDYVRVYQPRDAINVGCDPPDMPTRDWIACHLERYKLSTWEDHAEAGRCSTDPEPTKDLLLALVVPLVALAVLTAVFGCLCIICRTHCCAGHSTYQPDTSPGYSSVHKAGSLHSARAGAYGAPVLLPPPPPPPHLSQPVGSKGPYQELQTAPHQASATLVRTPTPHTAALAITAAPHAMQSPTPPRRAAVLPPITAPATAAGAAAAATITPNDTATGTAAAVNQCAMYSPLSSALLQASSGLIGPGSRSRGTLTFAPAQLRRSAAADDGHDGPTTGPRPGRIATPSGMAPRSGSSSQGHPLAMELGLNLALRRPYPAVPPAAEPSSSASRRHSPDPEQLRRNSPRPAVPQIDV